MLNIVSRQALHRALAVSSVSFARKDGLVWSLVRARRRLDLPLWKRRAARWRRSNAPHEPSQMVMLKDNHIWSHGSITEAVKAAKTAAGFSCKIEVNARASTSREARAGADIAMLDNFGPERLAKEAAVLKSEFPHLITEASGGITEDNIAGYAVPHVDVISMGCLTHGYSCLDYSMKIQRR